MGFWGLLGNVVVLKDMYELIMKIKTTDQVRFERQIRKNVRVVYGDFCDILDDNGEFQNMLPPGGERQLADQVIDCLWKDLPFTEADVLPEYADIPEVIRKGLVHKVLQALYASLEYAVRDYMAWSRQSYRQIDDMLRDLTTELIRDSARDNHCPRSSGSRFHYSNEWTKLWGRDEELKQLQAFCLERQSFSWWAITGEGGSGKTRLAYAHARQMEQLGWTICAPPSHDRETLYRCSESLRNNTLFLLDYSEYDTGVIGQWIQSLQIKRNHNISIRVLLVQRIGRRVQDIWPDEQVKVETTLQETVYGHGDFLRLEPLGKTDLIRIIKSFASRRGGAANDDAEIIYRHLGRVDGRLQRPLFAMILTDAYLDHPDDVRLWNRDDILNYIYIKEVEAMKSNILRHCGQSSHLENLYSIGLAIQMMATMTGGFRVGEDTALLSKEFQELDRLPRRMIARFLRTPALFGEQKSDHPCCSSLEPDIIGEYFVLRQWEECGGRAYIWAAWSRPYQMGRFVSRLLQDFSAEAMAWMDDLTNITLISSVTFIGESAFWGCKNLTSITIPDSVTSIGASAFWGCESLASMIIPNSVTFIGNSAFRRCKSITGIDIPDSVTSLEYNVFSLCESLTSVTIPGSVTSIGEYAFFGCESLTRVTISDSVTAIGDWAFGECKSLTGIDIPDSVISLGKNAFSGCESLTRITISGSITSIEEKAFCDCRNLTSLLIPDSVASIGCYAFWKCTSLTSVTISNSVVSIGERAFLKCASLTNIAIPDSVISIEMEAFSECESLTSVTIPDSVISIGSYAFWKCKSLTGITIPDSVTSIAATAFLGCTSLKTVSIPDHAPYNRFVFPFSANMEVRRGDQAIPANE